MAVISFPNTKYLLIFSACCAVAYSTNQVLLTCGSGDSEKGSRGFPGKRGPPGIKGQMGQQGIKGDIGPTGVSQFTQQELDLIIGTLNSSQEAISSLEREIQNLKTWVGGIRGNITLDGEEWYAPGNGFVYRVLSPIMSYDASKTACRNINSTLAVAGVKDINIRRRIWEYNRAKYPNAPSNHHRKVWLGLTDRAQEGQWVWDDGTPLLRSQANWYPGNPSGGRSENCAEIFDGRMNDINCGGGGFTRPLCERPM